MAEWKTQIGYNYNPPYHAYAYGLVYPPGAEQNHGNVNGWGESTVTDFSSYNPGMTQVYYAAAARTREESPPQSPEQHVTSGHCHYQGSSLVYFGESQASRLLLAAPQKTIYDIPADDTKQAGSDSTSDSEAHASPDSWSLGCTGEGSSRQTDPAVWIKKELDENSRSPTANNNVSSSLMGEPHSFTDVGNEETNTFTALPEPKKPSTTPVSTPKGKVRAAFSESQMNALVQRFSVQRYLTPAEMKNLAELTGLTYKQVKTWFQNRRMKLRRHQKDTSWVSERYTTTVNRGSPVTGTMLTNVQSHITPYQGEVRPQQKDHYNHSLMEAAFKKSAPQNIAFYLAAMGSAPAGYSTWSANSPHTRTQPAGWPIPPCVNHYEFSASAFNSPSNTEQDLGFYRKEEESGSNLNTVIVNNPSQ